MYSGQVKGSTALAQSINQRAKRSAPVTDTLLLDRGSIAEGAADLVREEVRVVAEAVRSGGHALDASLRFATTHDVSHVADIRRRAHVAGRPIVDVNERAHQLLVVRVVERLPLEIVAPRPPFAAHTRLASQ